MKHFLRYLSVVFIIIFTVSCTKPDPYISNDSDTELYNNLNFIAIFHQEKELLDFIKNASKSKGITLDSLLLKITEISNNGLDLDNQKKEIDLLLGVGSVDFLEKFAIIYVNNYNKIKNNKNYTLEKIDDACKRLYTQSYVINLNQKPRESININDGFVINKVDNCGIRYYLCMAGATAVAISCHASCISATAGFGTPVCLVLCGTIQVAAGVACIDNYCPIVD